MNANTNTITVKFYVASLGSTITLTGDRKGVLETVAIASGADAVEIRHSTNDDGTMVVVDASQAEEYPQFLAEIQDAQPPSFPACRFGEDEEDEDWPPTNTLRAMRLCPRCERPMVDHDDEACPEVTAETVTREQIRELHREAETIEHNDVDLARMCTYALGWDPNVDRDGGMHKYARGVCADAINTRRGDS